MQNGEYVWDRTKIIFAECLKERVYILYIQTMQHFLYTPFYIIYIRILCDWLREKWVVFNFHIKLPNRIYFYIFGTLPSKLKRKMIYASILCIKRIQIVLLLFTSLRRFNWNKILGENICTMTTTTTCNLPDIMLNGTTTSLGKCKLSQKKCNNFFLPIWYPQWEQSFVVGNTLKVSKYQKPHWNQISKTKTQWKDAVTFCSGWQNCCSCLFVKRIDYIIRLILLQLHFTLKVLSL